MANEIKVTHSAPELEAAIVALADAIKSINVRTDLSSNVQPVTQMQDVSNSSQPVMAAPIPAQVPEPEPQPQQNNTAVAAAPAPAITLDAIVTAGAGLVEKGCMNQVIALLGKYGVQAVNQIRPEQYDDFAKELRALGAQI